MSVAFIDVVEDVKQLSAGEKEELRDLIDCYLSDERRDEILRNFEASKSEVLESSYDIERLKELLNCLRFRSAAHSNEPSGVGLPLIL